MFNTGLAKAAGASVKEGGDENLWAQITNLWFKYPGDPADVGHLVANLCKNDTKYSTGDAILIECCHTMSMHHVAELMYKEPVLVPKNPSLDHLRDLKGNPTPMDESAAAKETSEYYSKAK